MLTDLFTDGQTGLNRLSELTGAESRDKNFVNWIAAAEAWRSISRLTNSASR